MLQFFLEGIYSLSQNALKSLYGAWDGTFFPAHLSLISEVSRPNILQTLLTYFILVTLLFSKPVAICYTLSCI